MPWNDTDKIEVHERLARIEAILDLIKEGLEDQQYCDEKLEKKIDQILQNDKDKIERITANEHALKNIRTTLWLFVAPVIAAVVHWFV